MRPRRAAAVAASLAALALPALGPRAAAGQRPAPAGALGAVHGVVFDSLGRRPLAGATVQLVPGAPAAGDAAGGRAVVADSAGAFRIDSLAPGRYLLGFLHPLLDLLRVEAAPRVVDVAPDVAAVRVDLALPALAAVRPVVCGGAQAPDDSSGLLAGRVRDAADGALVADATVVLTWSEVSLGVGGVRTERRRVPVTTDPRGRYVLCGVPSGEELLASAAAPGRASGEIALEVPPHGLVVRDLALGDSAAAVAAAVAKDTAAPLRGTARLTGPVRDSAGRPVRDARAVLRWTAAATTVGADGSFALGGLPAGTHTLEVRAIGYALRQLSVDLVAGRAARADVGMERAAALAPVTVVGTASALAGFLDRRLNDRSGQFLTAEDIERRDRFELADALDGLRGVAVRPGRLGKRVFVRGAGGSCIATVFLDGVALPLGDPIDRWVGPRQVAGVEVYADGVTAPLPFRQNPPRLDGCGVVVIWRRR